MTTERTISDPRNRLPIPPIRRMPGQHDDSTTGIAAILDAFDVPGQLAGLESRHAHLHVVPYFVEKPLAGQELCYHIKQARHERAQLDG